MQFSKNSYKIVTEVLAILASIITVFVFISEQTLKNSILFPAGIILILLILSIFIFFYKTYRFTMALIALIIVCCIIFQADFFLPRKQHMEDGIQVIATEQTVTVPQAKVMWQKACGKELSWIEAKDWVLQIKQKGYLGFYNWRLPSRNELLNLRKVVLSNPGTFFDVDKWHWSGDNKDLIHAWAVNPQNAKMKFHYHDETENPENKDTILVVRLVRTVK